MAVDIFLKIGDGTNSITGDSGAPNHQGELIILSYYWGETLPGSAGGKGGAGAGKATLQDFRFSTAVGSASQGLFGACGTGKQFSGAVLTVQKAGSTTGAFLVVTMTSVIVSSYQMGVGLLDNATYSALGNTSAAAANQSGPIDEFSLNFAKISYSYGTQSPAGKTTFTTPTVLGA